MIKVDKLVGGVREVVVARGLLWSGEWRDSSIILSSMWGGRGRVGWGVHTRVDYQ